MKIVIVLFLLGFTVKAFSAFNPIITLPVSGGSITVKGGLITSNGTTQIPFLPCANDEIIVWDSAETAGFKCEAKPIGGGGASINQVINQTATFNTFAGNVDDITPTVVTLTHLTTSFTTTSTNPVFITIPNYILAIAYSSTGGVETDYVGGPSISIYRDGTLIAKKIVGARNTRTLANGVYSANADVGVFMDNSVVSGTTYVYSVELSTGGYGRLSFTSSVTGVNQALVLQQY